MTEKGSRTSVSMQSGERADARVVPVACFARVTKPAVAKGPATAPIIPGVPVLARLGIARRCQRLC